MFSRFVPIETCRQQLPWPRYLQVQVFGNTVLFMTDSSKMPEADNWRELEHLEGAVWPRYRCELKDGLLVYSIVLEAPAIDRTFWRHVGANTQFDESMVSLVAGAYRGRPLGPEAVRGTVDVVDQ